MKTLYGITNVNRSGDRLLSFAAQGRHMFDSRAEAEAWLELMLANTSTTVLEAIFGEQSTGTFRADPFECYDHGDPVGIFVTDS